MDDTGMELCGFERPFPASCMKRMSQEITDQ